MTKKTVRSLCGLVTVALALVFIVCGMSSTVSADSQYMYDGIGGTFTGSGPSQKAGFNTEDTALNGWGYIDAFVVDEDNYETLHVMPIRFRVRSIVVGDKAYTNAKKKWSGVPEPGSDQHGVFMTFELVNTGDLAVSPNYMMPLIGNLPTDWIYTTTSAYTMPNKTGTYYFYANAANTSEMIPTLRLMLNDGKGTNNNNYVYMSFPVEVPEELKITSQPRDVSVTVGSTASFTVEAVGEGTLTYQWQSRVDDTYAWGNCSYTGANTKTLSVTATTALDGYQFRCVVKDSSGKQSNTNVATLTIKSDQVRRIISATAKYNSIAKTSVQGFTVVTTADVKYLSLYSENRQALVKTWAADGNSSLNSDGSRTWSLLQSIGTAGDRRLVFVGGTTKPTPVTNEAYVSFKVEKFGVISVAAKYPTIEKATEQTFTVKTTADCTRLSAYAEDEKTLVRTWTATSSNSSVSGNERTWKVTQTISNPGKRTLKFRAGTASTMSTAQRFVGFTVAAAEVQDATVKYSTIGKNGTQVFTVKTNTTAKYLMLFAEGGNLVKTWGLSDAETTVNGNVRTWVVKQPIGTVGNRELVIKAGASTVPSKAGKKVNFSVVSKKVVSSKVKYNTIVKASLQEFTVVTTADVQNLMLYSEDGKTLVKAWAATGNSTADEANMRKWVVYVTINTAGNRNLVIKGGTTNTTPATNAVTTPVTVINTGIISASVKYSEMSKGLEQGFTVKTTSDSNYLVLYGEGGAEVAAWTATSSNSTVSGNVRTWTVYYKINTAGNRKLTLKAGNYLTTTAAERIVTFKVY